MPYRLMLALLFLYSLICCKQKSIPPLDNSVLDTLLNKAGNADLPFETRLATANKALQLSIDANNIPDQIKSLRAKSIVYWDADSLDQSLALFREIVHHATRINDTADLAIGLNNIGMIMSERSVYDSAAYYHQKAAEYFAKQKDTLLNCQSLINAGIALKNAGDFEKAFSITTAAVTTMETIKAVNGLGTGYTTLGNILKDLNRPKEALAYHHKAIAIRTQLKDSAGIAGSYNNIGNVHKNAGDHKQALAFYLKSLALKNTLGLRRSKATTTDNIAETYLALGNYELAEKYELESLSLRSEQDDKDGWMTSATSLSRIYLARNQLKKAETLALDVAAKANEPIYIRQLLDNTLVLQEIYTKLNDHVQAMAYAKKSLALKDSLFNSEMSASISAMNIRFQTEQQQKKLEIAEKNTIIQEQQLSTQRYYLLLMAGIIVLLFALIYLLFQSNRFRKRARERTELLMTELNHRVKNNLQVISEILNLQAITTEDAGKVEVLQTARKRIQSIGIVHKLLYQKEYTGSIDMGNFITDILQNLNKTFQHTGKEPAIEMQLDHNVTVEADQAVPIGLIINELVTNIFKYGSTNGEQLEISVELTRKEEDYQLCITDNGLPWTINKTKSDKGGLGLLLIDMLTQQLKAAAERIRKDDHNIYCIVFKTTANKSVWNQKKYS